ncbi:MAG TPA: helix-turn-helix domain-containing protein [Microthrixaceae bacterium]|nr:helix-turn-helix domain-containing protein [Microthrixaceae bacterium]
MTTRDLLLDEAERLFARSSIAGVTTREIVESARQRNTSSISYHFGSRDGLVLEILARRGGPVDEQRGVLRDKLGESPPVRDLIACLVVPQCELLLDPGGRSYIRIVGQLRGRFASWRIESDEETTTNLVKILDEIEERPEVSSALRRERVVAMIMLMTASSAERARQVDDGAELDLSHGEFVENLVDMCAALVDA